MFISSETYHDTLCHMIKEEPSLDIAVAFWGEDSEKLIEKAKGNPVRIICNLLSGATNPVPIRALLAMANVTIQQCDQLHAKVILGRRQALVGSANLSANGLGFEGAHSAQWLEAGLLTTDRQQIAAAQSWFDMLWDSHCTRSIDDHDLEQAERAWLMNRRGRRLPGDDRQPFSLDDFSVADLQDRPAYALLYRSLLSEEAKQRIAVEKSRQIDSAKGITSRLRWRAYETWPTPLESANAADYIGIHIGARNGIFVDTVSRMVGRRLHFSYTDHERCKGWVDLALPSRTLLGRPFNGYARARMRGQLASCYEAVWDAAQGNSEHARTLHLADLARIIKAQ